jgi:CRP-like cAMP-binding protein
MLFRNATNAVAHPAGATIFKEGDPGDVMYVVQEGELQILVRGQAVETLGPGSIVGEMALSRQRSPECVPRCKNGLPGCSSGQKAVHLPHPTNPVLRAPSHADHG